MSDIEENMGSDESIPVICNLRELMSDELYSEDKPCDRCYPVTSYCRGHVGKILFEYNHISYVYRKRALKIARFICECCCLPLSYASRSASDKDRSRYYLIADLYKGEICSCTGLRESNKGQDLVTILEKMYERLGESVKMLGLPSRNSMLKNYVMALPYKLLKQVAGHSGIWAAYGRLLESHSRGSKDVTEMLKDIDRLYKCYTVALKDKPGIFRQLLVPRRMGNCARGVIVSNPYLGICDIGIPRIVSRVLSVDHILSNLNMDLCIDMIRAGHVSYINYGKDKYRLCSREIHVRVMHRPRSKVRIVDICKNMRIKCGDVQLVVHQSNIRDVISTLQHNTHDMLTVDDVEIVGQRYIVLYVDVSSNLNPLDTLKLSLQKGCILNFPRETQTLLIHRNPVLSAGSMHMHHMVVAESPSDLNLTLEERMQQTRDLPAKRGKYILEDRVDTEHPRMFRDTDTRLIRSEMSSSDTLRYRVVSEVRRVVERREMSSCVLSINPVDTTTYQADFDGDEMNVHSLGDSKFRSIFISDDLDKNSVGPIHDARYGLHCIKHDLVGLSLVMKGYKSVVCSQIDPTLDYPSHLLLDIGLSREQVRSLLRGSLRVVGNHVLNVVRNGQFDEDVADMDVAAREFISYLRVHPERKFLRNHNDFNSVLLEYYRSEFLDMEHLSDYYSSVVRGLYSICDRYGMSFDRLEEQSVEEIVESNCRPQRSTCNSIYKEIGFTSHPLPDEVRVSYIQSNYGKGVTEDEFVDLCFSSMVQMIDKAVSTAPEGDNMRLQCNYLSDVIKHEQKWEEHGRIFYETGISREVTISSGVNTFYSTLSDTLPRTKYDSRIEIQGLIHIGQRKLLMSEMDFLTDYAGSKCTVVYAGAGGGSHISALVKLFPNVEFHLYDTVQLSSRLYDKVTNRPMKGIRVHKKYLDAEIASRYKNFKGRVLYISDIRTRYENMGKPTDDNISQDNILNVDIIRSMNPYAAMVKFRLPFSAGVSTLLSGELRLQCWTGSTSAETRLICTEPYLDKEYNHTVYEEQMFYHNLHRPGFTSSETINEHLRSMLEKYNIEPHYDAYRENYIVNKYSRAYERDLRYVYEVIELSIGSDWGFYISRS
jgi:hypothetical protein